MGPALLPGDAVTIRQVNKADIPMLADLYREVATVAGPEYYTPTQVRAWACFADEDDAFRSFILDPATLVAEDESGILGFGGLASDGHIASLYVRADRLRTGIGTTLLSSILDRAREIGIRRLYAETGPFSLPLFLRFGFAVVEIETVNRRGAVFRRSVVELLP